MFREGYFGERVIWISFSRGGGVVGGFFRIVFFLDYLGKFGDRGVSLVFCRFVVCLDF